MRKLLQSLAGALRPLVAPLLVVAWAVCLPPSAAAVQLTTSEQGHIRLETFLSLTQVQHFEFVTAMDVKSLSCCGGAANAFAGDRAYAFFAIPSAIDLSGGAVLRFNATLSGPASTALTLQEIFSPLPQFLVNYAGADATGIGLFNDLGNGPVYGATPVAAGSSSFALVLSSDARSRIEASRGGFFGIGFTAEISNVDNPMTLTNMVLEVTPVPEPSAFWLLLAGGPVLAWARRRKPAGQVHGPSA